MRFGVAVLLAGLASPAAAFTFESQISAGCHERVSFAALELAGWPDGRRAPPPTELDRRVLDELAFGVPERGHDGWTLALLIGVRDNDVLGLGPRDLPGLNAIHNDPHGQDAHCLRAPPDDGPAGDGGALDACRAFLRQELEAALGPEEALDLEALEPVTVTLAFSGRVELPVRRFAFHAGRALHALEDSYTHALRSPSFERVRHVLNFVDHAREGDADDARDGHRHLSSLDRCDVDEGDPDAERQRARVGAATAAAAALLRALADPEGGRAGRLARATAIVDDALELEPGCTADNAFCDAPELLIEEGCACASTRRASPAELLLLALFVAARRRRGAPLLALAFAASFAPAASAQVETSSAGLHGPALVKPRSESVGELGLYVSASGALDSAALAGAAALRWQISQDFTLGLDLELNPWLSLDAGTVAPGALNGYATVVYRWWSIGEVDLRLTGHAGVSVLLFDLVGADAGSVGPYLGLSLLGVAFRATEHLTLVADPADLAFPIPSLGGVPFYYRQYRFTVGAQWNP